MGKAFLCKSNGGGGGLAFRVLGGISAPSSPKPNDIWINTDTEITSYIFSATEPEGYAEGMVWISTETSSSVEFNALKKNGIQVYPLSAKQYVSGAWVEKTAKSYRGGEWIDWARLPGDYQEVEYVQTTGSQYIDTGIIPSDNTYQVSTKIGVTVTTQDICVFGTDGYAYYHLTPFSGEWHVGLSGGEGKVGSYPATVGSVYEIEFNDANHGIVINDSTLCSGETYASSSTIKISSRNDRLGQFKYYYFRVSNNTNGTVLRDMVPCYRRTDSVAGMYDLVSDKFFANNGSGAFVVGGDVQ